MVGRRSDIDPRSRPTVSRCQRNLSFSAEELHDTLSRLCQLLRRRTRAAVHAGDDVGRQGRTAQRDAATAVEVGPFAGVSLCRVVRDEAALLVGIDEFMRTVVCLRL